MANEHRYAATLRWTGAARGPTSSYASYSREYLAEIAGKPPLRGSADPTYRGDPTLHNPEDLLLVALSACHMLSYLALCARVRIDVVAYEDEAAGIMAMKDGKVRFTEIVLRPRVTLAAGADRAKALTLHHEAHEICFIASSVNFPIRHEATIAEGDG